MALRRLELLISSSIKRMFAAHVATATDGFGTNTPPMATNWDAISTVNWDTWT